jgi:hypothetical protein
MGACFSRHCKVPDVETAALMFSRAGTYVQKTGLMLWAGIPFEL